jgi:hypothetical protein
VKTLAAILVELGKPLVLADKFIHETGDQDQTWAQVGLTADVIAEKVRRALT